MEELCRTAHFLQTSNTETAHKKVLLLLQSRIQIQIQVFIELKLKGFYHENYSVESSGKTEFQTLEENKKRLTRTERTFIRTRTSRFTRQTVPIPHINNLMLSSNSASKSSSSQYKVANGTNAGKTAQTPPTSVTPTSIGAQQRPYESCNYKIQSTESPSRTPRNAWISLNQ